MKIRLFEFGKDLDPIIAIDVKSHEEYWTEDDFKKRLKQKSISCLVVEDEGAVIGFIVYELFLHRFSLLRIGVAPLHRHKTIGSALLNELAGKLTDKRTLISAEVRETNLPIQLFLKSQNYKAVEVLRNYYPDTEEDAFVFHYRSTEVKSSK